MPRVITVKQLSTMIADTTKKQRITRTPLGGMRFMLDIIQTKLPWLI